MDEDFGSSFDERVCDTDDFSVEEPIENFDTDDVGAWMDEVPEIETQAMDVLENQIDDFPFFSEEDMDIVTLMDSADEIPETNADIPEIAMEQEVPEETPEILFPQEFQEIVDAQEVTGGLEVPGETPEILLPQESQEIVDAQEVTGGLEVPGETPEILLPQEFQEIVDAQEVAGELEVPEEVLEPEEGLSSPYASLSPLPGQQELIDAWMEGEDPEDTLEDTWDTSPDTEEQTGDTVEAPPQEVDATQVPENIVEDAGLTIPSVNMETEALSDDETDTLPTDTETFFQEENLPVDTVHDILPNSNVPAPASGEPDGGTIADDSGVLDNLPTSDPGSVDLSPNASPLEQMNTYMAAHNYSQQDFSIYCQDPEWQHLNHQLLLQQEIPPTAAQQMNLYMSQHNYGREDYPEYSQDPEWQHLNEAMQQNPDMPLPVLSYGQEMDISVEGPADYFPDEREPEESFSPDVADTVDHPEDISTAVTGYYEQGINDFGFEGTCGPTSIANGINQQLGTNTFTENDVLSEAIQEGLCYQDTGSPADSGGTTTDQFIELYEHMNELSGNKLDIQRYDFDQVLSMEEVARQLDEGRTVHVAVDADTLWNNNTAELMGTPEVEKATDHWITVTSVERSENNEITGFHIIDSGGGVDYVDVDTYQTMCYGSEELHLTDPTCIVVSRKSSDTFDNATPMPIGETVDLSTGDDVPADRTIDPSEMSPAIPDLQQSNTFFAEMLPVNLTANQAAMERLSVEERGVYLQALEAEPAVTADIRAVTEATGGNVAALEHHIKSPVSLEEMLHDQRMTTDIHNISNILQYTQTFQPEDLVACTNEGLSLYEAKGYKVCDIANTWEDDTNPYNGIHVKLISPSGQKLEVQFHTPESFSVNNGPIHQLYNEWRKLPEDSVEAMELQNRMFALSRQLKVPRNISEVRKR